jgi:c-di-GMP-binding flagellar brake protein YcgR
MDELIMLRGAEPRNILQTATDQILPATMSYWAKGERRPQKAKNESVRAPQRYVAKVRFKSLGANRLTVAVDAHFVRDSRTKTPAACAMKLQPEQQVSISLKHGYARFVFDTEVMEVRLSDLGPEVVLLVPEWIKIAQRRSFLRVAVPEELRVSVQLWRRCESQRPVPEALDWEQERTFWQGRLVDISAGGAQIALNTGQGPDLKERQVVELAFIPLPYEVPLKVSAQIRNILLTADNTSTCLGLEFVGLEASPRGRSILKRLCNTVERYYELGQSSVKQQDVLQKTTGEYGLAET